MTCFNVQTQLWFRWLEYLATFGIDLFECLSFLKSKFQRVYTRQIAFLISRLRSAGWFSEYSDVMSRIISAGTWWILSDNNNSNSNNNNNNNNNNDNEGNNDSKCNNCNTINNDNNKIAGNVMVMFYLFKIF